MYMHKNIYIDKKDFGYSVAISDVYALIGNPSFESFNSSSANPILEEGSVDVYKYNSNTSSTFIYDRTIKLSSLKEDYYALYTENYTTSSNSIASLSGSYSLSTETNTSGSNSGSVAIFNNYEFLLANSEDMFTLSSDFGRSLDIYENLCAIGCTRMTYTFLNMDEVIRNEEGCIEIHDLSKEKSKTQTIFAPINSSFLNFTSIDTGSNSFGWSVSINKDFLVVGSPYTKNSGSVFIFKRDSDEYTYHSYITSSGQNLFGSCLKLDKNFNKLIVGNGSIIDNNSKAYLYEYVLTTDKWELIQEFTSNKTVENLKILPVPQHDPVIALPDGYGNSVSIYCSSSTDVAVAVGAPYDRIYKEFSGSNCYRDGCVYVYNSKNCILPSGKCESTIVGSNIVKGLFHFPNVFHSARAVLVQPDDSIFIGGEFIYYNAESNFRNRLVKLSKDGELTSLTASLFGSTVRDLIKTGSKIITRGIHPRLGRFNSSDGSTDNDDNTFFNNVESVIADGNGLSCVAVTADNKILISGNFTRGVKEITAGFYHTVVIKRDNTVAAWGLNNEGQTTGTPTTAPPHIETGNPVTLSGQVLRNVVAIAAGWAHTVALKSDGTVVAWGSNNVDQRTVPAGLSGVVAIAAGNSHTVALKSDGTVVAWGSNDYGQTTVPFNLSGVVAIAAGENHTVALKSDGTVVAWGNNYFGQTTGTPTTAAPYTATANPVTLNGQILSDVVAIAGGLYNTVALKLDGTVVAWGSGQTTVPAGLSGVVAIAAGEEHTVALKSNGTVVAWGANYAGQTTVPDGLSGVVAIAGGERHTVALKSDGTVVAWGGNDFSQSTVPSVINNTTTGSNYISRINGTTGEIDPTFSHTGSGPFRPAQRRPVPAPAISAILPLSNNKILVGGHLPFYDNVTTDHIVRLNSDGTLDQTFTAKCKGGIVNTIVGQIDNKILVGGSFTSVSIDGVNYSKRGIFRLNENGTFDTSFVGSGIGAGQDIHKIFTVPSSGKIMIIGSFTTFNGISINKIARLHNNGDLDTSFNPGESTNAIILDLDFQSDGKMVLVGDFSKYNGKNCNRVVRITRNGDFDSSFLETFLYNTPSTCSVNELGWKETKLFGDVDSFKFNRFGHSVDISEDKLLISCPKFLSEFSSSYVQNTLFKSVDCDDLTENDYLGMFYIYDKQEENWNNIYAKFKPRKRFGYPFNFFAHDVSIHKKNLIVGSPIALTDSNRIIEIVEDKENVAENLHGNFSIFNLNEFESHHHVGNVFYRNGKMVFSNSASVFDNMFNNDVNDEPVYDISYNSKTSLYEKQIICTVSPGEFNYSTNPTAHVPSLIQLDLNKNGKFDFQDCDKILRGIYKKFNGNEQWWNLLQLEYPIGFENVVEKSKFEYYLTQSIKNETLYNLTDSILTTEEYNYIVNNLDSTLDINQDGLTDNMDLTILWKYFADTLTADNYEMFTTSKSTSSRSIYSVARDYLDTITGKSHKHLIKDVFHRRYVTSSNFTTQSFLSPYITTIGLYNNLDLIGVVKLGTPIKNEGKFPLNFIIRFDI